MMVSFFLKVTFETTKLAGDGRDSKSLDLKEEKLRGRSTVNSPGS